MTIKLPKTKFFDLVAHPTVWSNFNHWKLPNSVR